MLTPSLSIQSTQPGPTLHGTNTRHQFPFLNHQTELLTLTTTCKKRGNITQRPTTDPESGGLAHTRTPGTVLGLRNKANTATW